MSGQPVRPLHQAFSWVDDGVADVHSAEFAALTMNVCHGVQTCLELVHKTDISVLSGAGDEDPPVLGSIDKERLVLLATAAVRMLGDRAEKRVDSMNKQAHQVAREGGA